MTIGNFAADVQLFYLTEDPLLLLFYNLLLLLLDLRYILKKIELRKSVISKTYMRKRQSIKPIYVIICFCFKAANIYDIIEGDCCISIK